MLLYVPVYILLETKFNMFIVCYNHHGQYFTSVNRSVHAVLTYLIPAV